MLKCFVLAIALFGLMSCEPPKAETDEAKNLVSYCKISTKDSRTCAIYKQDWYEYQHMYSGTIEYDLTPEQYLKQYVNVNAKLVSIKQIVRYHADMLLLSYKINQ